MDKGIAQGVMQGRVQDAAKVSSKGTTSSPSKNYHREKSGGEMTGRETDTNYQRWILAALNNPKLGKHIYAGTADPVVVSKRRKANKVARKQRRGNNG